MADIITRIHFSGRFSRQSMYASTPEITAATALGHKGMEMPLAMTSHVNTRRRRCATAISEKISIAIVVKVFMLGLYSPQYPLEIAAKIYQKMESVKGFSEGIDPGSGPG
jgi:hypothetical protein